MSHRAHTPLPQSEREITPSPDSKAFLATLSTHGATTYTTTPTEQISLDPSKPDHAEILAYTDTLPMSGYYLSTSEHHNDARKHIKMAEAYQSELVEQARLAYDHQKEERLDRVAGK
jgi:hypothetical protein